MCPKFQIGMISFPPLLLGFVCVVYFSFWWKPYKLSDSRRKKRKRKGATVITHFMFLFYCESEIDQRSLVFLDMVSAAYVCQTLFVQGLLGRKLQFSDHILKFVPVSTRLLFVFSCSVLRLVLKVEFWILIIFLLCSCICSSLLNYVFVIVCVI